LPLATAGLLATAGPASAQEEVMTRYPYEDRADLDLAAVFEPKWDVMIPMRDGVRLHTEIYIPRGRTEPLPIMLERTPYYANPQDQEYSIRLAWYEEFFDEGYIFVLQDLRGRYESEGEFVTLRPNRKPDDVDGTDESTDFYDTIEWLVNNVPGNNGRVGTWGISYGGFLATRAMVDPHPALAAVSPQATCADMFIGDDFHHNGAFRFHYAYEAAVRFEMPPELWPPEGAWDKYTRYLEMGPLSRVTEILDGNSRMWNDYVAHPNLDEYWETEMCGVLPYLQGMTVPALHVTGWWDAEDFYGPIEVYKQLEANDDDNENFLVLGPWRHGGWTFEEVGRQVLDFDLESETARYFRDEIHAPWFAYWLKDKGSLPAAEAITFQTGSNEWKQYDSWPAEGMVPRNVYLRADGVVSFDPPPASEGDDTAYDEYVSDPDNPVPFQYRPIHYDRWHYWQAEDQRFVDGRPDVLTWESEPLEEGFAITGDIVAHLFASTSGTGADWIVKLIDVYPDDHPDPALRGYQYMVAGEVFRARFRNSFRVPEPVVPNEIIPYTISLRDRDHHALVVRAHIPRSVELQAAPVGEGHCGSVFLAGRDSADESEFDVVFDPLRFAVQDFPAARLVRVPAQLAPDFLSFQRDHRAGQQAASVELAAAAGVLCRLSARPVAPAYSLRGFVETHCPQMLPWHHDHPEPGIGDSDSSVASIDIVRAFQLQRAAVTELHSGAAVQWRERTDALEADLPVAGTTRLAAIEHVRLENLVLVPGDVAGESAAAPVLGGSVKPARPGVRARRSRREDHPFQLLPLDLNFRLPRRLDVHIGGRVPATASTGLEPEARA